jgi:hypothetical protein
MKNEIKRNPSRFNTNVKQGNDNEKYSESKNEKDRGSKIDVDSGELSGSASPETHSLKGGEQVGEGDLSERAS